MERPSEASQSRGSTWKGLLIITASILSCWIQPMSARGLTVVPNPANGKVGAGFSLRIQGYSGPAIKYNWYYRLSARDPNEKLIGWFNPISKTYSGGQKYVAFLDTSIRISNLGLNDSGYYEVEVIKDMKSQDKPRAGTQLTVYDKCCPTHGPYNYSNSLSLSDV